MTDEDMPWVIGLTDEEVQELRKNKQELTQYGKEKIRELMNNQEPYPDEMFEEAERREKENKVLEIAKKFMEEHSEAMEQLAEIDRKEFYRFFAVDYFATGEGISYWLKICRNYSSHDGVDRELKDFKEFIGEPYYYSGIEEPTEEEFMEKYANLIPSHVVKMIGRRDQPILDWETHFHVNYS